MNQVKNYQTKQKQVILDLLQKNHNLHMTAEQILTALKNEQTPVGKATLYRYLDTLIEQGEVKKYILDNMHSCYQYIGNESTSHQVYHLMCNLCGKVIHVDDLNLVGLNNKIKKTCDFEIDPSKVVFYGICKECMKHEKN